MVGSITDQRFYISIFHPYLLPMSTLILSLSTATDITSVALHEAGKLVAGQVCHKSRSAGESLPGMVRALFNKTGRSPGQLSGVAIASGPGSYTGLRIGTAFAKGLCYAQNLPLIPINTLVVLCHSAKCFPIPNRTLLYALLDARRSHVYGLLMDQKGEILQDSHLCHITALKLAATHDHDHVYLVGSGGIYQDGLSLDSRYTLCEDDYPKAEAMGHLAYQKWHQQQWASLDHFEPTYLSRLNRYKKIQPVT